MAEDNKLKLIASQDEPISRPRKRSFDEPQQVICGRCNGSVVIEMTLSPFRASSGGLVGGTKIYACSVCYKRDGEIVELARK